MEAEAQRLDSREDLDVLSGRELPQSGLLEGQERVLRAVLAPAVLFVGSISLRRRPFA